MPPPNTCVNVIVVGCTEKPLPVPPPLPTVYTTGITTGLLAAAPVVVELTVTAPVLM